MRLNKESLDAAVTAVKARMSELAQNPFQQQAQSIEYDLSQVCIEAYLNHTLDHLPDTIQQLRELVEEDD